MLSAVSRSVAYPAQLYLSWPWEHDSRFDSLKEANSPADADSSAHLVATPFVPPATNWPIIA